MNEKEAMNRYDGRPLLRLLECYVLWVIGHLSQKEENVLVTMTPQLRSIFKSTGDWKEIVTESVDIKDSDITEIKKMWNYYSEIAKAKNTRLTPQNFSEAFVDKNFT